MIGLEDKDNANFTKNIKLFTKIVKNNNLYLCKR